ncbi:MAG TPA: hypothetical protein VFH44_06315 [Solirubrobacterales bacterium]|nr:hypothetical protein [Solirubrobacterales bacterium]
MRLALLLLSGLLGAVLAALGDEPPIALALAAVILYPLGVALAAGGGEEDRPSSAFGPALLAVLAGVFLIAFLIRLAIAAPGWVDPLSADCGGPSTGAQQLATWFATLAFLLAAIPEVVTLTALVGRIRGSDPASRLPVSLGFYPAAVALAGIALIVASWATSC